jgi:hypothetical protein
MMRYLNLYLQRERTWISSLKSHGLPTQPPFDWRENEAVAVLLLERALGLVENWPKNMQPFVRTNKTRFNRLRAEYRIHLPKTLVDLVGDESENESINVESEIESASKVKEGSAQDRVGRIVQHLLETNAPVSMRAVCRMAKVGFERVKTEAQLNDIILERKNLFRLKQEAEIREAIEALRARGLNPSVRSIATYLGRSHRYVNAQKPCLVYCRRADRRVTSPSIQKPPNVEPHRSHSEGSSSQ